MKIGIADKDEDRGSGRTSDQMRAAPKGALFIWVNDRSIGYARHLAHHLGRDDLDIRPVSVLDRAERLLGLQFPAVVFDHAVRITDRQGEALDRLMPSLVRGRVA